MTEENKKLSRKNVKDQLGTIIKLFQKKTKSLKPIQNKVKEEQKDSLQETINYLRVCVKYTIFDLEASRREIEALKKLLKDGGKAS